MKKTHRSSFFFPMHLLPSKKRTALLALYNLCHALDECVDNAPAPVVRERLLFWHGELEAIYRGSPTDALAVALQPWVKQYKLSQEYFRDLIAGFEMDYSGIMRKPGLPVLELYCYRVASCVGLLACELFGCTHPASRRVAIHLGKGMQMINILRDIAEDAQRGRIYLPRELLERHGLIHVSPDNLLSYGNPLHNVCKELAALARGHLAQARALVPREDKRKLFPALLMRDIYRRQLSKLETQGWLTEEKIRVSSTEQLGLVAIGLRHLV